MVRACVQAAWLGGAVWLLAVGPCPVPAQPLDTTSESSVPGVVAPSAGNASAHKAPSKDTLPQTTGPSGTGSIEIGTDTTRLPHSPSVQQTAQNTPLEVPFDDDRIFSLFNYAKIAATGSSLSWLYYKEHPDINPIIRQFRNLYLIQPSIIGTPKSNEYGAVMGFNLDIARFVQKPHLFVRSRFALLLGIANTYDGSLQPVADTAGGTGSIVFTPKTEQKNNIFICGGIDVGPAFADAKCPWTAYTGLDLKVWYRDMTSSSEQSAGGSSSELYYWLSVPLGMIITKPVSPRLLLGCEPRVDFMFYGRMQASESDENTGSVNFPALTLGNRASFRVDAFLQTRLGSTVSLRFGPYVMLYGFAQSNTDTVTLPGNYGGPGYRETFTEPESASLWIGINFMFAFLRNSIPAGGGR